MAAEVIVATRAADGFPVFQPPEGGGVLCAAYGTVEIAAGNLLEAGDVIEFCKVPARAVIVGGWVYGDTIDADTGSEALNIDFGWLANGGSGTYDAANATGLGDMGVLVGTGITGLIITGIFRPAQGQLMAVGPFQFTKETTFVGTVNVAADTTGTGTLTLVVLYLVP